MLRINASAEGTNAEGTLPDTYIDVRGWGKGLLWVNGVNLGWFWPSAGPQARALPAADTRRGMDWTLCLCVSVGAGHKYKKGLNFVWRVA